MAHLREVLVADLPWPFKPFKCDYFPRVKWLLDAEDPTPAQASVYCSEMLSRLSPDEAARCPYHSVDWRRAADVAVSLHRAELEPGTDAFDKSALAEGAGEGELAAIRSFWFEPISWQPGQASVSNGQHRSCALKLSGATRVLVEVL